MKNLFHSLSCGRVVSHWSARNSCMSRILAPTKQRSTVYYFIHNKIPQLLWGNTQKGRLQVSFQQSMLSSTMCCSGFGVLGLEGTREKRTAVYSWVRAAENCIVLIHLQNRAWVCFIGVQAICLSSKGKFYPLHFKDSYSLLYSYHWGLIHV